MKQEMIPLQKLFVSNLNARKDLNSGQEDSGINELAESIKKQGLLSPPIVRPTSDGRYELLIGQRRFLACKKIGHDPMPCLIRDNIDDDDAVAISLVENVHRADMHPLDKAISLKTLYDKYGSYEKVAKETAWSATTIRKYIQLLLLPEDLQKRISTTEGPAKVSALSKLAQSFSGDEAVEVYDKISGFKQSIQEEIIKKSGGDLSTIDELVEDAEEGAFDTQVCGGDYGCALIREILEGKMKLSDFHEMVEDAAEDAENIDISKTTLKKASKEFWKLLAKK